MASTSTAGLDGDNDRARSRMGEDKAASVSRDRLLVPNGDDDAKGEMEVEVEAEAEVVDLQPQPRKGVPKTMRELAESYAQQQGEVMSLPQGEKEADLAMVASNGRRERGTSSGGAKRRPGTPTRSGTRTRRTSKKRARRRSESEGASDVDGEEETYGSPLKRRQLEASVSPAPPPVSTLASTPNPDSGATTGRVLRPRPQKSAARMREESAMEEAYRRAVAG